MRADSPNWVSLGDPASPAEAAAQDAFRELLEDDGMTKAWANLSFIDDQGRLAEVDVLLLTRRGFYIVELKGWHGHLTGNSQTWTLRTPTSERTARNPYILTDNKAKRLSSLLKEVAPANSPRLPYVGALIVLHGRDSIVELDKSAAHNVLRLDGYNVRDQIGNVELLSEFLKQYPANPRFIINKPTFDATLRAIESANFVKTPKQRQVGQYVIDNNDPIVTGPDYQDFVVKNPTSGDMRRIRLYDLPANSSRDDRLRIEQAAKRELRLTQTIRHDGIESPLEILTTDSGPALVFPFEDGAKPLDEWLNEPAQKTSLTFGDRVEFVRQLAEVLRYAHNRRLNHRALSPNRVWVTPDEYGDYRLMIRDWYAGTRSRGDSAATSATVLSRGVADVAAAVGQQDWYYLAPESLRGTSDVPAIPLDVYGVGALAYLILTGEPPAENLAQLHQRIEQGALDPRAAKASIPDAYAEVIAHATQSIEADRTASIEDFLHELEDAGREQRAEEPVVEQSAPTDPVDAQSGDVIDDRFTVLSRRGDGSTGTALVVTDVTKPDGKPVILKVARSEPAARRLVAEADALRQLDHPRIVRLLDEPVKLGAGRTALVLSDAGEQSLASRIAAEGRATITELERFGNDLLEAVAYLDERGIFHRDIKPANFGISPDPTTKRPRLNLFDFSLSKEPIDNVTSGTTGYVDPYLGMGHRRQYDRAAELWSVAMALFELATANRPWWPDGGEGPLTASEAPVISLKDLEPSIAEPMQEFFTRALAPNVKDRYATVEDLATAWRRVFATLDESPTPDEGTAASSAAAEAADKSTPLAKSGLSARALSALARHNVETVGDLLELSPMAINSTPGLGEKYRKEIQGRIRAWRDRLGAAATVVDEQQLAGRGLESIVAALTKTPRTSSKDAPVLQAFLGVADGEEALWPTVTEAASVAGVDRKVAYTAIGKAVDRWTKLSILTDATNKIIKFLEDSGRVATLSEVTSMFAAQQGSQLQGVERSRYAAAVVRAMIEVEEQAEEPRLTVRRRSDAQPLIALTDAATEGDTAKNHPPAADLLLDLATALGTKAEQIAAETVIPVGQAKSSLRELVKPGIAISDDRLVHLAAATSASIAASSFDELYPVNLDAASAIDYALRGRPGRILKEEMVAHRVRSRFPELTVEIPKHPELDELIANPLPGMKWDGKQYTAGDTTAAATASTQMTAFGTVDRSELARRLDASIRHHSTLTLGIVPAKYQEAIATLATIYRPQQLKVLDVARMVIESARDLADRDEVPWEVVLDADAAARNSADWNNLTELIREAMQPRWQQAMVSEHPLLVVNAGPLVRYGLDAELSTLTDVGATRPAARWLLVAHSRSIPIPRLEGKPVPLGPSGVLDLPPDLDLLSAFPAAQGNSR